MSHLKKAQVVMLPTNEKAQMYISKLTNKGLRLWTNKVVNDSSTRQNQHLYILSDEELKEGDWVIDYIGNTPSIFQIKDKAHLQVVFNLADAKKIIAATDDSLTLIVSGSKMEMAYYKALPQPSQSFLEVYAREYSKGNGIKEVMVEYENLPVGFTDEEHEDFGRIQNTLYQDLLKVNPKDNTITIKRVKDSWNRGEYEEGLRKAFQAGGRRGYSERSRMAGASGSDAPDEDKWIEQNL